MYEKSRCRLYVLLVHAEDGAATVVFELFEPDTPYGVSAVAESPSGLFCCAVEWGRNYVPFS